MKKNLKNKKSLSIAMLGHKRIPSREGGIEIVVEELATRMVTLGHKVTCYNRSGHHVSGKDFDGGKRKAYKGVRLAYISEPLYNYLQRTSSISRNKKINHDFIEAAKAQMEYLDQRYPKLKIISHTAYASANLTVYDFYLKNGVKCSKENIVDFKKAVRENRKYIDDADFMRRSKKIQFQLFLMNTTMYNIVFRIYRKIKRV